MLDRRVGFNPCHYRIRNHVLTAGSASTMTELIVVLVSSFLIGFCATDVVWHRLKTGSWL